jgi:hypothetical protein
MKDTFATQIEDQLAIIYVSLNTVRRGDST